MVELLLLPLSWLFTESAGVGACDLVSVRVFVATLSCCPGSWEIQMHVFDLSVFSTSLIDSGSSAEVGSTTVIVSMCVQRTSVSSCVFLTI